MKNKILGGLLVSVPFWVWFAAMCADKGFLYALGVVGLVLLITAPVITGIVLLNTEE